MPENLHPRVQCYLHILGADCDIDLLNEQASYVVLSPGAPESWPTQFEKIEVPVYAYLHTTGVFTEIPEDEPMTHRGRMKEACEAAGILSDVQYGLTTHVDLDRAGDFARIYIEELERINRETAEIGQPFTGFFIDNCYASYSWLTKKPEDDDRWDAFKREFIIRLKRAFGLPIIINDSGYPVEHATAGRMIENVPVAWGCWETLLSILTEESKPHGPREVIVHDSTVTNSRKVLAFCLLFGATYSPRLEAGVVRRVIPADTLGKWKAVSGYKMRREQDKYCYYRLFEHVETGVQRFAALTFDRRYTKAMSAQLPWE